MSFDSTQDIWLALQRWLKRECTEEERRLVQQWISESTAHADYIETLLSLTRKDCIQESEPADVQSALERFRDSMQETTEPVPAPAVNDQLIDTSNYKSFLKKFTIGKEYSVI